MLPLGPHAIRCWWVGDDEVKRLDGFGLRHGQSYY
jgi:hypothetical protein